MVTKVKNKKSSSKYKEARERKKKLDEILAAEIVNLTIKGQDPRRDSKKVMYHPPDYIDSDGFMEVGGNYEPVGKEYGRSHAEFIYRGPNTEKGETIGWLRILKKAKVVRFKEKGGHYNNSALEGRVALTSKAKEFLKWQYAEGVYLWANSNLAGFNEKIYGANATMNVHDYLTALRRLMVDVIEQGRGKAEKAITAGEIVAKYGKDALTQYFGENPNQAYANLVALERNALLHRKAFMQLVAVAMLDHPENKDRITYEKSPVHHPTGHHAHKYRTPAHKGERSSSTAILE